MIRPTKAHFCPCSSEGVFGLVYQLPLCQAAAAEGADFAVEVLVVRCKDRQLGAVVVVVGGWDLLQPGLGVLVVVVVVVAAAGQHRDLEQFVHLEIRFRVCFPLIFKC